MPDLDDLDRRLIAALRRDARAPAAKLASILGVARGTVQARMDRLIAAGVLLGFTVRLRQEQETGIRAVMMIEVAGRFTDGIIRRLHGIPELQSLHTTNGAWDLVAEVRADSLADFDRVLREVRAIDGILNSETSLLLAAV